MADIKFSQFTPQTGYTSVQQIVGYNGSSNVRISPSDLISSWNGRQSTLRFQNNIVGTTSFLEVGAASHTLTELNLATSASASYQINGLKAASYGGTDWVLADGSIEVAPTTITLDRDLLVDSTNITGTVLSLGRNAATPYIKNAGAVNGTLFFGSNASFAENWAGLALNSNESVSFFGSLFNGTQSSEVGRVLTDPQGGGGSTGFPATETMGTWKFSKYGAGNKIDNNTPYVLGVDASGHLRENLRQPACQVKISGGAGLANTNNGADFLVPYNTVTVNDDATIFNPVVTGGLGNQGAIQVLKAGRYAFQARYSSFDLTQPGLPTVDGNKFFRITASTDTAAAGIGTKQCVLQDLIVATSGNGEAVVTGAGYMDLNANDYFKIIGFHNGATGGTGTQGFPVSNNALFNEPQLWLVKIQ